MTEQLKTNALYVFATEVIHGAYKPEELKDAAMRAIRHHSAQPAQAVPVLTDAEIDAAEIAGGNSYRRWTMSGPRGQMLLPGDSLQWHIARAIEQAVRAKMGVAVPMTAAGQMFAEAKKAVGVTFRVNPNLDAETVRQAHVAVSEAPPYELPDWQKAALCVCREVVTAWGSEESRAAHGIVGKEGA